MYTYTIAHNILNGYDGHLFVHVQYLSIDKYGAKRHNFCITQTWACTVHADTQYTNKSYSICLFLDDDVTLYYGNFATD